MAKKTKKKSKNDKKAYKKQELVSTILIGLSEALVIIAGVAICLFSMMIGSRWLIFGGLAVMGLGITMFNSSIKTVSNDPPENAILVFLNDNTSTILHQGFHLIPPFVCDILPINITRRDTDFGFNEGNKKIPSLSQGPS